MRAFLIFHFVWIISISGFGQNINDLRKLFDYDKGQDPDFRILDTADSTEGTCYRILYSGVNGQKITASLIIPKQNIREFPVVIYFPDNEQSKKGFIGNALALAKDAFAGLILDAPMDRPEPYRYHLQNFTDPRKDLNALRQSVLDVRRSIDLIEHHGRIDRNRIAFVGCGSGAITGAIASGVESRILTFILMDCISCYTCELRSGTNPLFQKVRNQLTDEQINHYETTVKILDPSNYLPFHRNALLFFQFAQNDPGFDDREAKEVFRITGDPKNQKYYKTTGQGLSTFAEACLDRKNWMKNHL